MRLKRAIDLRDKRSVEKFCRNQRSSARTEATCDKSKLRHIAHKGKYLTYFSRRKLAKFRRLSRGMSGGQVFYPHVNNNIFNTRFVYPYQQSGTSQGAVFPHQNNHARNIYMVSNNKAGTKVDVFQLLFNEQKHLQQVCEYEKDIGKLHEISYQVAHMWNLERGRTGYPLVPQNHVFEKMMEALGLPQTRQTNAVMKDSNVRGRPVEDGGKRATDATSKLTENRPLLSSTFSSRYTSGKIGSPTHDVNKTLGKNTSSDSSISSVLCDRKSSSKKGERHNYSDDTKRSAKRQETPPSPKYRDREKTYEHERSLKGSKRHSSRSPGRKQSSRHGSRSRRSTSRDSSKSSASSDGSLSSKSIGRSEYNSALKASRTDDLTVANSSFSEREKPKITSPTNVSIPGSTTSTKSFIAIAPSKEDGQMGQEKVCNNAVSSQSNCSPLGSQSGTNAGSTLLSENAALQRLSCQLTEHSTSLNEGATVEASNVDTKKQKEVSDIDTKVLSRNTEVAKNGTVPKELGNGRRVVCTTLPGQSVITSSIMTSSEKNQLANGETVSNKLCGRGKSPTSPESLPPVLEQNGMEDNNSVIIINSPKSDKRKTEVNGHGGTIGSSEMVDKCMKSSQSISPKDVPVQTSLVVTNKTNNESKANLSQDQNSPATNELRATSAIKTATVPHIQNPYTSDVGISAETPDSVVKGCSDSPKDNLLNHLGQKSRSDSQRTVIRTLSLDLSDTSKSHFKNVRRSVSVEHIKTVKQMTSVCSQHNTVSEQREVDVPTTSREIVPVVTTSSFSPACKVMSKTLLPKSTCHPIVVLTPLSVDGTSPISASTPLTNSGADQEKRFNLARNKSSISTPASISNTGSSPRNQADSESIFVIKNKAKIGKPGHGGRDSSSDVTSRNGSDTTKLTPVAMSNTCDPSRNRDTSTSQASSQILPANEKQTTLSQRKQTALSNSTLDLSLKRRKGVGPHTMDNAVCTNISNNGNGCISSTTPGVVPPAVPTDCVKDRDLHKPVLEASSDLVGKKRKIRQMDCALPRENQSCLKPEDCSLAKFGGSNAVMYQDPARSSVPKPVKAVSVGKEGCQGGDSVTSIAGKKRKMGSMGSDEIPPKMQCTANNWKMDGKISSQSTSKEKIKEKLEKNVSYSNVRTPDCYDEIPVMSNIFDTMEKLKTAVEENGKIFAGLKSLGTEINQEEKKMMMIKSPDGLASLTDVCMHYSKTIDDLQRKNVNKLALIEERHKEELRALKSQLDKKDLQLQEQVDVVQKRCQKMKDFEIKKKKEMKSLQNTHKKELAKLKKEFKKKETSMGKKLSKATAILKKQKEQMDLIKESRELETEKQKKEIASLLEKQERLIKEKEDEVEKGNTMKEEIIKQAAKIAELSEEIEKLHAQSREDHTRTSNLPFALHLFINKFLGTQMCPPPSIQIKEEKENGRNSSQPD